MGEVLSVRRATGGTVQNGTSHFYGFDLAGNTRLVTDAMGAVAATSTYTAFGEEVSSTGTVVNAMRFGGEVGYYTDKISRVYVRTRHYAPQQGRWISQDPIGFEGRNPNLYRYVGNNPVNWSDPEGLRPASWIDPGRENELFPHNPPVTRPSIGIKGGYGNWCGYSKAGPKPPIDCADNCCKGHDNCLATPRDFANARTQCRCNAACRQCTNRCIVSGCRAWFYQSKGESKKDAIETCIATAYGVQRWCQALQAAAIILYPL